MARARGFDAPCGSRATPLTGAALERARCGTSSARLLRALRCAFLAGLLLPLLFAAACGGAGPPGQLLPGARWRWVLSRGEFAEVNLILEEGASTTVTYRSDAALSWDVHRHVNGRVLVLQSGDNVAQTLRITAPMQGIFSALWQHAGAFDAAVTLEVAVAPDARVDSTYP